VILSAPTAEGTDSIGATEDLGDVAPRPRWPGDEREPTQSRWERIRRSWHFTWPILLALVFSLLIWGPVNQQQWEHHRALFWLDLGLGLAGFAVMPWRHRYPVQLAIAMTPLNALSAFLVGPDTAQIIALSRRRRLREIVPITVATLGFIAVFGMFEPYPSSIWVQLIVSAVFIGAATAFGMYLSARAQLLATLRERAESAEREQALRIAQARRQERDRIAREMHDVLAHRISLVCMHAGALSFRIDATREEIMRSVDIIERNAHQALADLREVIGVLRERDEVEVTPAPPQPTLSDVSALLDELRAAGMQIDLTSYGPDDANPPDSIGRSAYRIVQEGLTNARKHAPGARVLVTIGRVPGQQLLLRVVNPLSLQVPHPIPGSGTGLQGLAERAAISGGDLEHGIQAGQFVLSARLPWVA
jgi:signal transduction histidine kinase